MKRRVTSSIAALWLMLCCGLVSAAPISEIVFEGNEVTREKVLRQELLIREGDEANEQLIEESRLAIMNLGLFQSVLTSVEDDGPMQRVIFTVEERFFLLPIPRLGLSAKNDNAAEGIGSYHYGLELRYDNVMGLNHRLKLIHEREKPTEEGTAYKKEDSIRYLIPRITDSEYMVNLEAKQRLEEINLSNDIGTTYKKSKSTSGGVSVSRWLAKSISRGWRSEIGLYASNNTNYEQNDSIISQSETFSLGSTLGIHYTSKQEYEYHRAGKEYGYAVSIGLPQLGSDVSYTRHNLYFREYRPVEFADSNINSQLQLFSANGRGETYGIGNSTLLRGYDNDYAMGNAMLLANIEYHHHMSGYRQLRGVLFADIGNAWERVDDIDLSELLSSVGFGLRWRVQSFVDVTLRLDYGYALTTDSNKLTLNTKASF